MLHTLGVIPVPAAGTPVNAVAVAIAAGTQSDPDLAQLVTDGQSVRANTISVHAWLLNTDVVYIGRAATMNLTTGAGVLDYLAQFGVRTFGITGGQPAASGLIDVRELWIDVAVSGEGVIISYELTGKGSA